MRSILGVLAGLAALAVFIGVLLLAGGRLGGAPAAILLVVVLGLLALGSRLTGIWSGGTGDGDGGG